MRRILRRFWRDERGVSLVVIALTMTTLLSLLAFSLDLGLLYIARAEAQRAADAAALAGASAFLNYAPPQQAGAGTLEAVEAEIESRAVAYVNANPIRGVPGRVTDIAVEFGAERSVRLTVQRQDVPLWFAQLFGISARSVAASATAGAVRANSACVAPLAFEQWGWTWGDGDEVESITPDEPASGQRQYRTLHFAGLWENSPRNCRNVTIGDSRPEGPTISKSIWASRLIGLDPEVKWNPQTRRVEDQDGDPVSDSPRIIAVVLADPWGSTQIRVSDFLLFFIESANDYTEEVHGRFLAYVSGSQQGQGPVGNTVLRLQLTQ